MYLGIDIGGTKTLVAALDDQAKIIEQIKFPTAKEYAQFLTDLKQALAGFKNKDFQAAGVGVPGH